MRSVILHCLLSQKQQNITFISNTKGPKSFRKALKLKNDVQYLIEMVNNVKNYL